MLRFWAIRACFCVAVTASWGGPAAVAGVVSTQTMTFRPAVADFDDFDHHMAYTWRIDGIGLGDRTITGARIKIEDIRNWDTNPNRLFVHLLDTARNSGVASFLDDPLRQIPVPVTSIIDDFVNPRYHDDSGWLVERGTADTPLTAQEFGTSAIDFTYELTGSQLLALGSYIRAGDDIAFGFDPDCHFFNDGVTFEMTTQDGPTAQAVPEPASLTLFGSGLVALGWWQRRARRAARPTPA